MNVAYILNSTVLTGGSNKSFQVMLKGLIAKGVNPLVVVPDRCGIYEKLLAIGVPVFAVTYRMSTYSRTDTIKDKLLFVPRMIAKMVTNKIAVRALAKEFEKRHIDIVHTNVGIVDIGFLASRRLGLPHIYHLREYGIKDFGIRYFPNWSSFYRQLNASYSYNICITRDIQDYHHQQANARSRVIYNGISDVMKRLPDNVDNKTYFLFAGRIQPAKGVDLLLEAYSQYVEQVLKPLPLKIAGAIADGLYMERITSFVIRHQLQEHVSFLGDCQNIDELMRGARAIIIPSLHEGFGRCMAEAMFQGCLVIGRNTSGTKEQFDNGMELEGDEIGLRYDTTDELAILLAEVASRPAGYYIPYINRAFVVVNNLYTQESNVCQIYDFYQYILHEENL